MPPPLTLLVADGRPLVHPTSRVTFRDYFARREGDDYVVGLPETSTYLAIPPVGVEVMRLLAQGLTVQEAALRLRDDEGQTPDVGDFVETMIAFGLVAEVDGRLLPSPAPSPETAPTGSFLGRVPPRYAAGLFSRPAFVLHAAVFVAVLVALAVRPAYLPRSTDFFVYHRFVLNLLLVVATLVVCGVLHEIGHLLAAHGRGLAGRLELRVRQVGINAEFPDAWRLPRRDRIVVYLGGLVVTLWLFAVALGVLLWAGDSLPTLLERWLRLVLVVQLWFFAWQLHFFKKTDGYLVVTDLLQTKGLLEDTRASLRTLRKRLLGRGGRSPEPDVPDGRRRAIRIYTVLYLLGIAVAIGFLGGFVLPFLGRSVSAAVDTVAGRGGLMRRVDAAALLALYVLIVALVARTVRRKLMGGARLH
jgi:putative peptide zinc metalloprotease protein